MSQHVPPMNYNSPLNNAGELGVPTPNMENPHMNFDSPKSLLESSPGDLWGIVPRTSAYPIPWMLKSLI